MNTCCICLDEKLCRWVCRTCNSGKICGDCEWDMYNLRETEYDEDGQEISIPINCPICRTPNIVDVFVQDFKYTKSMGSISAYDYDKYPVLYTLVSNRRGINKDVLIEHSRDTIVKDMVSDIFRNVIDSNFNSLQEKFQEIWDNMSDSDSDSDSEEEEIEELFIRLRRTVDNYSN